MAGIYDFKVEGHPRQDRRARRRTRARCCSSSTPRASAGSRRSTRGWRSSTRSCTARDSRSSGFPCNQFGAQEPGSEEEIESFCEVNYGVTFPLFAKVDVNGDDTAPRLQVPEAREARAPRLRGDQVEFHQVPGRPRRQGRRALRAERRAGEPRPRHRRSSCNVPLRVAVVARCAGRRRARARVRCAASAQADPNKVLHVVFPVAETGFDPQAWVDAYSDYINTAIFDPLYKYDYLARPYRIDPNTAAALPTISADGLNWTIKLKPGIYFADDPAFKGKKRELVAADYVYSWKRILDPKVHSANLQVFDQIFVGADAARREGEGDGQVRLRRAHGGAARRRPVHAAAQADASGLQPSVRPHHDAHGSGCARSDRCLRRRELVDDGEPGRHRSLPVARSGAAARRSCWKRIPAFARRSFRKAPIPRTGRSWRR